jgi:hypothetical protein
MAQNKIPPKLKAYSVQTINGAILRSAGFITDVHKKNEISTSAHSLPEEATKIKFRYLNDDKRTFAWTDWKLIKRK